MNRIRQEWLALYECAKIYYQYRKSPLEFYNNWEFRKSQNPDFNMWRREYLERIVDFKNKYQDKDCFIIGNGPSLNKMDLLSLNQYYTFGLNKIFLIFKKVKLNLDFLVSVNPLVIEQSITEFNNLKIPKFISYLGSKKLHEFDNFTCKIFTKGGLESTGNLENPVNEGYTVTNVALQIAFYLGFKNVFLIGVDHNFNQKGKPNEKQNLVGDDINHFDPNYFKGYEWQLADLQGSEVAYINTKFLYERNNRNIYDATLNGNLQVFEKISYEEALKEAKKKTD